MSKRPREDRIVAVEPRTETRHASQYPTAVAANLPIRRPARAVNFLAMSQHGRRVPALSQPPRKYPHDRAPLPPTTSLFPSRTGSSDKNLPRIVRTASLASCTAYLLDGGQDQGKNVERSFVDSRLDPVRLF